MQATHMFQQATDWHRRYPAIVTLHGATKTPEQQIDWWAGQASRYGYIIIAPQWAAEHQTQYQCSLREHTVVLDCLRAAFQRFSIDTDRVFLSGYSMGGDAAWDIGLAHPDLWAGVIPIVCPGRPLPRTSSKSRVARCATGSARRRAVSRCAAKFFSRARPFSR